MINRLHIGYMYALGSLVVDGLFLKFVYCQSVTAGS